MLRYSIFPQTSTTQTPDAQSTHTEDKYVECSLQCSGPDTALSSGGCDLDPRNIRLQELRAALKRTLDEKTTALSKLETASTQMVRLRGLSCSPGSFASIVIP